MPMKNFRFGVSALVMAMSASAAVAQGNAAITIVLPAEPADVDACNVTVTGIGVIVKENVAETLTVLDPDDSSVEPRLATAWEDVGGGTWRVTLREDVTFHDGTPFDAEAVVKAVERLQSDSLTCRDRTKIRNTTITATAVDAHTVDITAEPAQVLMPTLLSFVAVPSPNTPTDQMSRQPVGTGPYRFEGWDANGIVLARNDDYWGEAPAVAKASYVFRGESQLRAAMVAIGEADLAVHIAPQDATDPALDVSFLNGETTRIRLVMEPPLDDIRIRKALNLAFDRDALVGTLLGETVIPATQFILPKINGHNPDLKVWPYDPAQAAALVEEARADGVPVDREIRLIGRIGFFPNQLEVLQAVQQMWAAVGIRTKLEMMESAEWLKLVNRPYPERRDAMMIQEMHDNNNGDAAFTMRFRYHSTGQQSEMAVPDVDALLETAEAATGEERTRAFREANRIIADEIVPAVPMYHMVSYMRVGPRIDYAPNSLSGSQIELADIKLK